MGNNANQFREFLMSNQIDLEEGNSEFGTYFATESTIPSGPRVRIVALIADEDNQIAILSFNYANVGNPSKKEYILEKLNELNIKYTYNKFVLKENNEIAANVFIDVENNFSPQILWGQIVSMYQALEEEYKGFMRILWA